MSRRSGGGAPGAARGRRIACMLGDPSSGALTAVELPAGDGFLDACYEALGCRLVDCVPLRAVAGEAGRGVLAWTDDEGLRAPAAGYWKLRGHPADHAGRVLFTGEVRGEKAALARTAEDLRNLVEMYGARLSFELDPATWSTEPGGLAPPAVTPAIVRTL